MRLAGDLIGDVDERGEPIVGDTLLLLLNAHHEDLPFQLPPTLPGQLWELVFDTAVPQATAVRVEGEQRYRCKAGRVAVFRTVVVEEAAPVLVAGPRQTCPSARPPRAARSLRRWPRSRPRRRDEKWRGGRRSIKGGGVCSPCYLGGLSQLQGSAKVLRPRGPTGADRNL